MEESVCKASPYLLIPPILPSLPPPSQGEVEGSKLHQRLMAVARDYFTDNILHHEGGGGAGREEDDTSGPARLR